MLWIKNLIQLAKDLLDWDFLTHSSLLKRLSGFISPLQGIGGQASRNLMDQLAEILFALNKHCFSYLSVWIKDVMQQDGFPSARVTPEQKEIFSQQILRWVSSWCFSCGTECQNPSCWISHLHPKTCIRPSHFLQKTAPQLLSTSASDFAAMEGLLQAERS